MPFISSPNASLAGVSGTLEKSRNLNGILDGLPSPFKISNVGAFGLIPPG
jgi:hypothetical protein